MKYVLLVCVDATWGYTQKNQLPWHIPEETAHYHRTISQSSGNKKAFIIGKNTWLSASAADKKIMSESLCCLISKTYHPADGEKIVPYTTLTQAKHFLEDSISSIDTVYIIGGKDIYLESLQSNMVTTVIISKLRAVFECDRFLSELKELLTAQFFCTSQTYVHTDSIAFIIEEWSVSPSKTSVLNHMAQGLQCSLDLHPEALQQKLAYESWVMVLTFIIGSIHQYCNPYFPQSSVFELIATNVLKLFSYFMTAEYVYSIQLDLNGQRILEQKSSAIIERQEFKDWGWADILYENERLNTTVLCVEQYKSIQKHYHDAVLEHELFISGMVHTYYEQGPLLNVLPLAVFDRSFNTIHGYLNTAVHPAKIISLNDRIFDMKYGDLTQDDRLPQYLDTGKSNCLLVGGMEGIDAAFYSEIKDRYNLIYLGKNKLDDELFYIPLDFNNLESVFQVSNALPQLAIDVLIIASSTYSCSVRLEQPSYIFEETMQLNYLGPIFLLLELMNNHLINRHTKIMVFSSSLSSVNLPDWLPAVSPEELFNEPEHFNSDRQHALAHFATITAVYYLFQHGYNIMAINVEDIANRPLMSNELEPIIALLKTAYFETFYKDCHTHESVSEAVLAYDSAKLWDYSRALYFKMAHLPQKMRLTLTRPITLWTWNILGIKTDNNALNLNKRMNYLLQKIYYDQPDVICLQEITQVIWQNYLKPFSDKYAYRLSAMPCDIAAAPGKVFVATLSRLFPSQEELIELEKDDSGKDYYCLYQRYEQFELINVHLISGAGNQAKRMAQMQQIVSSIDIHNNCLIMGDFNADLNQTDLSLSEHAFLDVWHLIHPLQQGDTEDLEHNLLRKQLKSHDINTQSRRVDGIFAKKELINAILGVDRLGLEEVLSQQFISDHYGLTCTLEFK